MTNNQHGQVPEALIDLIDAYAETRYRCCGGIYHPKTEAARKAVIEALSGVQALSAAQNLPAGFLRDVVTLCSKQGASPESIESFDIEDRWIADLWRQANTLLAASPTPPAEQQAQPSTVDRTGCTAGTEEECTRRGCATSCPAQQAAPKTAPAIGDELRDTLVAVSAAIAERDDRAAQKMIGEILAASPTPPAEQQAAPKAAPECLMCNDHGAVGNILNAEPCPDCTRWNVQPALATQQAGEREQERIAFKDAHRHLELYEVLDAWGRPMFKHSHVEASWLGWIARASHGQAPAPPPECETEAEKRAFAFGRFKALESERMKADNKKKGPL